MKTITRIRADYAEEAISRIKDELHEWGFEQQIPTFRSSSPTGPLVKTNGKGYRFEQHLLIIRSNILYHRWLKPTAKDTALINILPAFEAISFAVDFSQRRIKFLNINKL